MRKVLTDVHTHSTFSVDGVSTLSDMLSTAYKSGVAYYGVSEHFDFENTGKKSICWSDENAYFPFARRLQAEYAGKMRVLVGAEIGFMENADLYRSAKALIERYRPDFVVNSVHRVGFGALDERGQPLSKQAVYKNYLLRILRSLDVPYDYDIVGHLGYCSRYAPYADRSLRYADYKTELDEIFKKIIEKDKILEVNAKPASARFDGDAPIDFVPQEDVLDGYYRLGGRKISYASDAHDVASIMQGRDKAVAVLKEIGFTRLTVPCAGERIEIEL